MTTVIGGWIFQIENTDGTVIDTVTTDENGEFELNLDPGQYVVREIGHETITDLSCWVLDSAKTVTVTAGEATEVSFSNTLLSELTVKKISQNSTVVAGWIFTVTQINDDGTLTDKGSVVTGDNGEISLLGLL